MMRPSPTPAPVANRATAPASTAHVTSNRATDVIVVEDDDLVRHALKRLLVSEGRECFGTATAENAQQLLTLHTPAFVITDLNLAGRMTGIELLAWMTASPRLRHVPTLLMTGDDRFETRRQLDAAGLASVEILPKPFDRSGLARLLSRLTR